MGASAIIPTRMHAVASEACAHEVTNLPITVKKMVFGVAAGRGMQPFGSDEKAAEKQDA